MTFPVSRMPFGEPDSVLAESVPPEAAGPLRGIIRRFFANKLALAGLIVIGLLLCFALIGPAFYHTDQVHTALNQASLPPGSPGHPMGTDNVGRDQLGRLMVGARASLEIGLAAGTLATVLGTLWGAVAGYIGGWPDALMMRVVDAGIAIPTLFLLLLTATIVTPTVPVLILVVGAVSWLVTSRLVRAEALSLRNRDYMQALRAMGGSHRRAIFRHIVPNAIGTVVVSATFQVADAILITAYLSFLGLGVRPPATDLGGMLSNGITYTYDGYWWLIYPAGVMIVLIVGAFNSVGDGLRDAFEVRIEGR